MPNLNSVYMCHGPPDKEKWVNSFAVESLETVSNFLSHKKYDGSMKLKLKDTLVFRPINSKTLVWYAQLKRKSPVQKVISKQQKKDFWK